MQKALTQELAKIGRNVTKPIGKSKARKFLAVEGMQLTASAAKVLDDLHAKGLKGDALRDALRRIYASK